MIAIEGAGAGDPILLLHGLGTNRHVWRRVVPLLAADRRVHTADLPGFGESAPPGKGFDLASAADALAAGLGGEIEGPFDLVGSSLGGAVAVTLAQRHADRVRRLVLCAPAGFTPRPSVIAEVAGHLGAGMMAFRRIAGSQLTASETARRVLFWGAVAEPRHLSAADARTMLAASGEATRIAQALACVLATDLRPAVASLRVPVGLLWGESDRVVSISTLRAIREMLPGSPTETIPGAGHIPQVECPEAFTRALRLVLDDLPAQISVTPR